MLTFSEVPPVLLGYNPQSLDLVCSEANFFFKKEGEGKGAREMQIKKRHRLHSTSLAFLFVTARLAAPRNMRLRDGSQFLTGSI